jgi:hypothetical protein
MAEARGSPEQVASAKVLRDREMAMNGPIPTDQDGIKLVPLTALREL